MSKLSITKKRRYSLWGGVAGLVLGAWFIFYLKNNFGFIPAVGGALLLIHGLGSK